MAQVNQHTARLYKQFRDHQRDVQASGGGSVVTDSNGREEVSYASAPYGRHAVSAFVAAKRHAGWMDRNRRAVA